MLSHYYLARFATDLRVVIKTTFPQSVPKLSYSHITSVMKQILPTVFLSRDSSERLYFAEKPAPFVHVNACMLAVLQCSQRYPFCLSDRGPRFDASSDSCELSSQFYSRFGKNRCKLVAVFGCEPVHRQSALHELAEPFEALSPLRLRFFFSLVRFLRLICTILKMLNLNSRSFAVNVLLCITRHPSLPIAQLQYPSSSPGTASGYESLWLMCW